MAHKSPSKKFFIQGASELAFRPLVECSAFATTPKYVKDGKIFIGQNLDTLPDLKKILLHFTYKTNKGNQKFLCFHMQEYLGI